MNLILQAIKSMFRKTENAIKAAEGRIRQSIPTKLSDFENDIVNLDAITPIVVHINVTSGNNTCTIDCSIAELVERVNAGLPISCFITGKYTIDGMTTSCENGMPAHITTFGDNYVEFAAFLLATDYINVVNVYVSTANSKPILGLERVAYQT